MVFITAVPPEVTSIIDATAVESLVTNLCYPPSSKPLEFLTIIHQVISVFSSFNGYLEICPEFSIPLLAFIACPTFASLEVMRKVSIALHLPVAYDDITRQLASDNDIYKFFACPYSVL